MNFLQIAIIIGYLSIGDSYTKYGRSCQDIGCPNNQQCIMQTDPCSYYHRQGECGSFPTCQRVSSAAQTCSTYVCPPTKVCRMDGNTPKCVDDASKVGHVGYDTQNQLQPGGNSNNQNGNLYPQLPARGQTTPRPTIYKPVNTGGYQGGQIGSGYPGRTQSGYPQAANGYPQQYPQQAYPQQGAYPQQTYPQQGAYPQQSGYPKQGGYPQQGVYPQQGGYPQQQGYYPQGNQRAPQYPINPQQNYRPPQGNQGTSLTDKITNSIKNIGGYLKNQLGI